MPELPEVETIVQDLKKIIIGAKFISIETEVPNSISNDFPFEKLINKKITSVERRGKFIIINFQDNAVLTIHLRMSGRLIFTEKNTEKLKYERTTIKFNNGNLRFCDMRKFGKVWLNNKKSYIEKTGIKNLGPEPLDEEFTFNIFQERLKNKKGTIKKNLLEQKNIAGIGNIYADETCFYAKINPESEVDKLNINQLEEIYQGVIKSLQQGIRNRGTSVSDYADAFGNIGTNQELLYVYRRENLPCLICKSVIQKCRVAGRGTHYCPNCQKLITSKKLK